MSKIVVISEQGRWVGTWIPPQEGADPNAPVTRPVAGKRQTLHEIEVDDATTYRDPARGAELETLIKQKLALT